MAFIIWKRHTDTKGRLDKEVDRTECKLTPPGRTYGAITSGFNYRTSPPERALTKTHRLNTGLFRFQGFNKVLG